VAVAARGGGGEEEEEKEGGEEESDCRAMGATIFIYRSDPTSPIE
jgi:hypothetical protein